MRQEDNGELESLRGHEENQEMKAREEAKVRLRLGTLNSSWVVCVT